MPGRFSSKERAPGSHWIGGRVGSKAGLDMVVERKIPNRCRDSNPRWSSHWLIPETLIPLSFIMRTGIYISQEG